MVVMLYLLRVLRVWLCLLRLATSFLFFSLSHSPDGGGSDTMNFASENVSAAGGCGAGRDFLRWRAGLGEYPYNAYTPNINCVNYNKY